MESRLHVRTDMSYQHANNS